MMATPPASQHLLNCPAGTSSAPCVCGAAALPALVPASEVDRLVAERLSSLADDPPDAMVEAAACAIAVREGYCTEQEWSEEVDPEQSRYYDELAKPALSAALREASKGHDDE